MGNLIFDETLLRSANPVLLDMLLADGWRHFGERFFRYNMAFHDDKACAVIPLRIRLEGFSFTKSQRKTCSKNSRLFTHAFRPAQAGPDEHRLFEGHKQKFTHSAPASLYDFISHLPASVPCTSLECCVHDGGKLVAASFLDIGQHAVSSVYGMFDLGYARHSLGTYTMLLEIEHALFLGKDFYYHGYCYSTPSFYDYKKNFNNVEWYDWKGNWRPLSDRGTFPGQ